MSSTGRSSRGWQLGELNPLAEIGLRIRAAYGVEPEIALLSAATLTAAGFDRVAEGGLHQRRDTAGLPVLTGDDTSLAWAVVATSMLLESDVAELVPDRFTADGHLDHAAWSALGAQSRDLLADSRWFAHRPTRVPGEVPDPGLIALKRFVIDSSEDEGVPLVLLDGPVPAAAALLADAASPGSTAHLVALQPGTSQLEALIYDRLSIPAILPWHTNLPDGSLAPLVLQIVRLAAAQSERLTPPDRSA